MARKILLADDSVTAQNMGRKILADAGYEVITVNNGSAALKKIAELKPELIILDVYMPGYSGLEVCQRLKDAQETARVPVLLTVGKLEPFKPDEAKRVRADGYIIKPFEASELLSALSKLEDKIVPKAEAGRPGRSGRVTGIEDSNKVGDEPVAEGNWKSRISIPEKKTESVRVEENPDGGDIYNTVNRDLKTVVAPGTPKTPTPSAHAQGEEAKHHQDEAPQHGVSVEIKPEEKLVDMGALALPITGLPKDVTTEEIAALAAAAAQVQAKKLEAQNATRAAEDFPEAKIEAPRSPGAQTSPTEAEVSAAIATLEHEQSRMPEPLWDSTSDNGAVKAGEDLPVTMAVAGPSQGSRWTAVPMAVDPQEAALSLEREMQTALREFSASAAEQAGPATLMAEPLSSDTLRLETFPSAISLAATTETPGVVPDAVVAVAPQVESLPAESLQTESATEAITVPTTPEAYAIPAVSQGGELAVAPIAQVPNHLEQPERSAVSQPEHASEIVEDAISPVVALQVPTSHFETPQNNAAEATPTPVGATTTLEALGDSAEYTEAVALRDESISSETILSDVAYQSLATEQPLQDVTEAAAPAMAEISHPAPRQEDSELAATTAAAWANWRQIRDSAPSVKSEGSVNRSSEPAEAALAVAAGAENSPSEAAGSTTVNPQEVARIVDNLLAELRPRMVEEIAKKLAEKRS